MLEHTFISYAAPAVSLAEMRAMLGRVRCSRGDALKAMGGNVLGEAVALLKERYARARIDRAQLYRADAAATVVLRLLAHCAIVATPIAAAGSATHSLPAPAARCVSVALDALRSCAAAIYEIERRCSAQPWLAVCCAARDATHALNSLRTAAALRNATPPRWAAFSAPSGHSVFASETQSDTSVPPCRLTMLRQRIEAQTLRVARRDDGIATERRTRYAALRSAALAPRRAALLTGDPGVDAEAAARSASPAATTSAALSQGSKAQRSSRTSLRIDVTGLDADTFEYASEVSAASPAVLRSLSPGSPLNVAISSGASRPQSYAMETAAALHRMWQNKRPMTPRGSRRKARMKTVGDARRGYVTIDTANTPFDKLPAELQQPNVQSAKVACGEVTQCSLHSLPMDDAFVERCAARVHEDWSVTARSWADAEQLVPYAVLSLAQQEPCRGIVHVAIAIYVRRHMRNKDPVTKLQARWRAKKERRRLAALGGDESRAQHPEAQGGRRRRRSSLGRLLRPHLLASPGGRRHSSSPGGRRQSFTSSLLSPRAGALSPTSKGGASTPRSGKSTPRGGVLTPRGSRRRRSFLG